MAGQVPGLPGIKTTRTATHRKVRLADMGALHYPGGFIIDGSKAGDAGNTGDLDVLRAGTMMGRITASKKWAPSFIGALTADAAGAATTIVLTPAEAVELVRRVGTSGTLTFFGGITAGATPTFFTETYSAVDTATGDVTVSALDTALEAGSLVGHNDGSEFPRCLIDDGYGIQVTDQDRLVRIDVPFPTPLLGGFIAEAQILLWPPTAEIGLRSWLKRQLNGFRTTAVATVAATTTLSGAFLFDGDYI